MTVKRRQRAKPQVKNGDSEMVNAVFTAHHIFHCGYKSSSAQSQIVFSLALIRPLTTFTQEIIDFNGASRAISESSSSFTITIQYSKSTTHDILWGVRFVFLVNCLWLMWRPITNPAVQTEYITA
jgi:hypothetical protein